jgi:hypothetical protein
MSPNGIPTLVFCPGSTAVPVNRSDPLLRQWRQNKTDVTGAAYFPPGIPGKWDGSATREASGRHVRLLRHRGAARSWEADGRLFDTTDSVVRQLGLPNLGVSGRALVIPRADVANACAACAPAVV